MYCGWPWRQNPASASRHLGHPSQYLFPVPWALRTSSSLSVVILCILVHVLRPHGRSFRPGQPALQLTRARSMSPAAGDGQQERVLGLPRAAGNGCIPAPGPERRRSCTDHWSAGEVRTSVRGAGQIPLQVEQRYLIPGFQRSALHRFHRRDASARFPSPIPQPRRLPWAYCADMTTWSVAGGTSPRASLSM